MNPFLAYISQFTELPADVQTAVQAGFVQHDYKRGELLLRAGEMANHAYFIESGGLRVFTVVDGEEITIWLGLPGSMVVSLPSFIGRKPSVEFIQALDTTSVYAVEHNALQALYDQYPEANRLGRLMMEQYAMQLREHGFSLRCHSTTERYETLLRQRPDLFQQVQLSHIASFLGMTAQAMSMARAKRN